MVGDSPELPSALRAAAGTIGASRGRALQLHAVFDRSLIPMVMVDSQRRVEQVNAAARLLSRMSLADLRGRRIDDFTQPQNLPVLAAEWAELMQRGTRTGRYHVVFPDGGTLWILYAGIANALPAQHLIVFVPADWPGDELDSIQPAKEDKTGPGLSHRQVDVLRLVAVGASASEIATELSISEATVRTHVKNILTRLGAHNRAHAVALAMTQGLLGEPSAPDAG